MGVLVSETITPNMNLTVPAVSEQPGPTWAVNINTSLNTIDTHDHTAGKGLLITPSALNINADLTFGGNNATTLRSVRFNAQGAPLGLSSDLGCVYVAGVDLYYNDVSGNPVRITQSGGVAGSPGSITGLVSPASATYVSGNQTFVWQSGVTIPANLDAGSVILRNLTPGSFGLTLSPPSSLSGNYTVTLPAVPGTTNIVTMDNTGVLAASWNVDNATIVVSSNNLKVADGGIGTTQLANSSVTPAKLSTNWQNQIISANSGAYTTGSMAMTIGSVSSSGRPINLNLYRGKISFPASGGGTSFRIAIQRTTGSSSNIVQTFCDVVPSATLETQYLFQTQPIVGFTSPSVSAGANGMGFNLVDIPPAGNHVYKLQISMANGFTTNSFSVFSSVSCMMYEI